MTRAIFWMPSAFLWEIRVNDLVTSRSVGGANSGDRIRDELEAMGVKLMDAKNPQTGEIETTWEVKR